MNLAESIAAVRPVLDRERSRLPADGGKGMEVSSVVHRSDRAGPGSVFVAIKGARTDGHRFVPDAVRRGAAAVVVEQDVEVSAETALVRVTDSRTALGLLAASAFGWPAEELVMIGVTGTNGKTTIAWLLEHILSVQGLRTGLIGTIHYRWGGSVFANPLTTPEATELQQILSEMRKSGVTHVVMEVSSHGLELGRVRGCRFDVGVFSNLSQDHLDFHPDMAAYRRAKKRLFSAYLGKKSSEGRCAAVVNAADPAGAEMAEAAGSCRVVRTGAAAKSDVFAVSAEFDLSGIRADVQTPAGRVRISSPLVGRFNLENILCAVGGAVALDIPLEAVSRAIALAAGVPGRLERVPDEAGRRVFVDYAHTPAALENVLETLREVGAGRLICVFGCGGDRDTGKREKMGEIAGRLSDIAVITSDNPRSEPPLAIIEAIEAGVRRVMPQLENPDRMKAETAAAPFYLVEPDREKAIYLAIQAAEPGDAVLIAGKGHETGQIVGDEIYSFDDRETAGRGLSIN